MKNKLILHIPHSSTVIPTNQGYVVDENSLRNEILKLTDWYTDDLFHSEEDEIIKAEFSRIFCDTERFAEDSQEVMAQFGMGALYEKNDEGDILRTLTEELKKHILNNYYWPHHDKLNVAVDTQLNHFGKALILDGHSYPSKPLKRCLNKNPNRPDFNIGTDSFHTPKYLIDLSIDFFRESGYSLGIDWPYAGSIVPLKHYQKNKDVQTLMLEINRELYLKEPTNEKSENYSEIKRVIENFIKTLKNSLG